jgi:hypothetical protein
MPLFLGILTHRQGRKNILSLFSEFKTSTLGKI